MQDSMIVIGPENTHEVSCTPKLQLKCVRIRHTPLIWWHPCMQNSWTTSSKHVFGVTSAECSCPGMKSAGKFRGEV